MDDAALCDSEEEVFCGPVTARELELMTRRKLWFRKTEVFKQKSPRSWKGFRRQSSGTNSDEEETGTKASTSGLKITHPFTVEDVQFRPEEISQDYVEESNETCGTLAPPPTPEPCVDVYKSTPPKGLKQMADIIEGNEATGALPMMEHSSPLLDTCQPDVGMESLQTLEEVEAKSADVYVDDTLIDILENITDSEFSSDSIDTSYEEEVYYTGEVDLQDKNESEICMSDNLMQRVVVPRLKMDSTFVVGETKGCVSYTKMTNDNLEHSIMSEEDSSEMPQFHAEPGQDSYEGVRMSHEAAVEVVVEDCDMGDPTANNRYNDMLKVIEPLEFHNEADEDVAVASEFYIKESLQSVDALITPNIQGEDLAILDQSVDVLTRNIQHDGLPELLQRFDTSLTINIQDEDLAELVRGVNTLVTLNIQDEDLAELVQGVDSSVSIIQDLRLAELVQQYKVQADFEENLAGVSLTETHNTQDVDDRKLVQPHELQRDAVNNIDDLKEQSNSFGILETDGLNCNKLMQPVQRCDVQRELKEPIGNVMDQLKSVATLETVNVHVEDEEMNELSVYKNDSPKLSESLEVFDKGGHSLIQSYPESGNDYLEEMLGGQIESPNTSSNVVIGMEQMCAAHDYTGNTKNTTEDQEQTTGMEMIHQEQNSIGGLETWDERDHEVSVNDSTNKQDSFNDSSTSTFQNQELPSFVNIRKKKYSTFFRSSTEDENEVQSSAKDKKESRIYSRTSDDRCSVLTTMNDDLIQGRSDVAERAILASSPTLDKLAEISKKYQHTEEDRAKPEKENYFLNALHRRYGNAKLTTRMSDLSLRSPRGGCNSSLSSLDSSNENEQSSNATPGTNESRLPLMSKRNGPNLSYSYSDVIESDVSRVCTSDSDTEIPESLAVNNVFANYSMISEPEGVANQVTLGLPQDVKMFSVLNTIQGNDENGNNMSNLYKNADVRASSSKTLPGNVSSLSADDDGGFLGGFTEIALRHAALQPETSTPKKYIYSIPESVATDVETNTNENIECTIAQPVSPNSEFNDTLEDMLLMEAYGMDYILGKKDRFSKPHVACDKSLPKFTNDLRLTEVTEGIDLMVSTKTSPQHSKEHPSTHEIEEYESHPILIQNYYKSAEEPFGEESVQLGDKPDWQSFDANNSQGRQRFFTDLISAITLADENTKGSTSTSPGIIPLTPDTKVVRSIVQPRKFFSDKNSVANENNIPKIKQANKKEFVFAKPRIIVSKPQTNYTHEVTPAKKPVLNKLKSPGVKVAGQCSSRGFVSPVSDKFIPTPSSGSSSSVSRIPKKSIVTTPGVVKKNPIYSKIQSPIGAYIKNSPTPTLMTNKNYVPTTKQIKAPATSSTQKKRLFPDIISLKEGRSVQCGSENIDTNNVGSLLPQSNYHCVPSLKLDTPSEMKMPHISDSLKRLVGAPMTHVLRHQGRMKVSTIHGSTDGKKCLPQQLVPRFIQSNPDDSCVVTDKHVAEISVVVGKDASMTDTIAH